MIVLQSKVVPAPGMLSQSVRGLLVSGLSVLDTGNSTAQQETCRLSLREAHLATALN